MCDTRGNNSSSGSSSSRGREQLCIDGCCLGADGGGRSMFGCLVTGTQHAPSCQHHVAGRQQLVVVVLHTMALSGQGAGRPSSVQRGLFWATLCLNSCRLRTMAVKTMAALQALLAHSLCAVRLLMCVCAA